MSVDFESCKLANFFISKFFFMFSLGYLFIFNTRSYINKRVWKHTQWKTHFLSFPSGIHFPSPGYGFLMHSLEDISYLYEQLLYPTTHTIVYLSFVHSLYNSNIQNASSFYDNHKAAFLLVTYFWQHCSMSVIFYFFLLFIHAFQKVFTE